MSSNYENENNSVNAIRNTGTTLCMRSVERQNTQTVIKLLSQKEKENQKGEEIKENINKSLEGLEHGM